MLVIYVNNTYVCETDTPRAAILMGISIASQRPDALIKIGNDWGDMTELRDYIEQIEKYTAIRVPEKELLNDDSNNQG